MKESYKVKTSHQLWPRVMRGRGQLRQRSVHRGTTRLCIELRKQHRSTRPNPSWLLSSQTVKTNVYRQVRWIDHWRKHFAQGIVSFVRYADDFVIGFSSEIDARRCNAGFPMRRFSIPNLKSAWIVIIGGKNRMREIRPYGSVRGAASNGRPYRDSTIASD